MKSNTLKDDKDFDDDYKFNGERFLEDRRSDLRESIGHFSNKNKPERERWVCTEFIENLGIDFEETEMFSHSDDPPDVIFRDAQFEIKEILDPGRRRHAEYAMELEKALAATDPKDLLREYTPKGITPVQVGDLILSVLKDLDTYYAPSVRANLDILFYVNLIEHLLEYGPMPAAATFSTFGWRSIAALFGWGSLVYSATDGAPSLLHSRIGTLTRRKFE